MPRTAISALALANAQSFGTSAKLDGRLGIDLQGRVGLAAAGKYMSPAELVARSTYQARKRQTPPKARR